MHTIIGSTGAIGSVLAKELTSYTKDIRLVSRSPKKVNDTDQLFPADVTDREQLFKAIEGSEVVYITVGFEYDIKVWRATWPPLIRNVIDACKKSGSKLVFFDNVYSYDPATVGHMTEENPLKPSSEKGKVRAQLVNMIFDEVKAGALTALIARAPDFYGPGNNGKSILMELVYANLKKGKAAMWMGRADKKHNFIFTPDAAKATAILGNTPDAFNQTWHLPTDPNSLTGKEWTSLFAKEMNAKDKLQNAPKWLVRIIGWFVPFMSEMPEMLYQYENDYFFDSSKFQKRFNFTPTPVLQGVKETIALEK